MNLLRITLAACALALPGCGTKFKLPGYPSASELREAQRLEQEHRAKFQEDGDPDAIRWLLARRVRTGMTVSEVSVILGREGEPVLGARKFKAGDGNYRTTDDVYKWGPDSAGKSYYLIFRDDRLTNYDHREFGDDS